MIQLQSGKYKGKKLYFPTDTNIRPTLCKTRSAIYNVIQSRYTLSEYHIIDLFAGSGALGLEGVSLGAVYADFIEKQTKITHILKKNITALNLTQTCNVFHEDAIKWLKKKEWTQNPYLFLIDPPYDTNLIEHVLSYLESVVNKLQDSLIVIETDTNHTLQFPKQINLFQEKKYRKTTLYFLEITK